MLYKMEEKFHYQTKDEDEEKPVRLSLHLLVKRHLPEEAEKWGQEQIVSELNKITHLRLDRERIKEIDSLELLGDHLTNIYLQVNRIEKIENLECCKNLTFLALANNQIQTVENLTCLKKLLFLDLSENRIKRVDVDELPSSLIILNFKGNPCTDDDYRGRIIQDMPNLKQLDLLEISREEKLEAGFRISSDEDDDDDDGDFQDAVEEQGDNGHGKSETFHSTATAMMLRSQKRCEEGLKVHKKHNMELDDLRLSWNVPASSRSRSSREVTDSLTEGSQSSRNVKGSSSVR